MWSHTFPERLQAWADLRSRAASLPLETALTAINAWWFQVPWCPYYLHWDDQMTWPDPWQLLSDDVYCEVARGLGILYTITLLDRADMMPVDLILTNDDHNLVQVGQTKYILNWEHNSIVNNFQAVTIKQQYQQYQTYN
jgi:hypothetical protein